MSRQLKIENFDPNGVGVHNGNFIGLPFDRMESQIVLITAPWDLTVSSGTGTHRGPENILNASYQLDLYDDFVEDAWKVGIHMDQIDKALFDLNTKWRPSAENYIAALESGQDINEELQQEVNGINQACLTMLNQLQEKCLDVLNSNQIFGIIGGDHSVALAGIKACATQHQEFGILQIDAHMDLRKAYEGLTYSHASIFYNTMEEVDQVQKLVQVGVRDYCKEEVDYVSTHSNRISSYSDTFIQEALFTGKNFDVICEEIISNLPNEVYISFDIDGLMPNYCQNSGTPVPGGLSFNQVKYLIKKVVLSGRKIIGFDLCEVAGNGHDFDGNVGARVAYMLCNYMGKSNKLS